MNAERGHRVTATVKCIKGVCNAGHKVGDVLNVSARDTAGMCGYLYHAAHPAILMLQFGGNVPWQESGVVELNCPDPVNLLSIELKRVGDEDQQAEAAEAPGVAVAATQQDRSEQAEPPLRFGQVICKVE